MRHWLTEMRENPRLRLGLLTIGAIVWVYAILLWSDAQTAARNELQAMRSTAERLRPIERSESLWQERSAEARQLVAGLQTYLWEARSRSLAEAAFRDWLQAAVQGNGLNVREISVRAEELQEQAKTTGSPPAAGSQAPINLRARVVTTFAPQPAASLLTRLHSNGKHVGVHRLVVRNAPQGQEPVLELDLVAVFAIREPRQ